MSLSAPRHVQRPHHRDRDNRGRQVPRHQEVSAPQLRGRQGSPLPKLSKV